MTMKLALAAAVVAATPALAAEPASMGRGSWIWCGGPESPRNLHVYFRKTFTLASPPASAPTRVTADSRYVLYVNGTRVSRGPARSHTRWLAYDVLDIAPHLRSGANSIAVLVHHYGDMTFRSQKGRGGLLLEADVQGAGKPGGVETDASWKCLPSDAWDRSVGKMGLQLDFPDVFDARKEPAGWNETAFNDAGWTAATVIGPAGMEPWTSLTPSGIPAQIETPLRPAAAEALSVRMPPPAGHIDFLPLDQRQGWASLYASTYLFVPKESDVTVQAGFDDAGRLWIDGKAMLAKAVAGPAGPGEVTAETHLKPGWHKMTARVVQIVGRWEFYFGLAGPGADGAVISADKNPAKPDTWRVSPPTAIDGSKGVGPALDAPFQEPQPDARWQAVSAPSGPMPSTAGVMRCERQGPVEGAVTYAASLATAQPGAVFQSAGGKDGAVLIDMGREVFGFPQVTIKGARGGEVVDMGYGEALEGPDGSYVSPRGPVKGRLNPEHKDVTYADRFICRPGDNTFQPLEKRAFRYWQVDVRTGDHSVTLADARVMLATYPVENRGAFECSDPLLNRIWDIGRWTLQLNMDDAYTDCPWRERAEWWGDVRIESLVNYYAFGDKALMRRALILAAQSQDSEGIVHGVFPTDWDGGRLPSFALIWVYSLWEYYLYTGDASLFPKMLPIIDRLMGFFEGRIDPKFKLLTDVPYWVFIDWAKGMESQRIGISGPLNCFYYNALTAASKIAAEAGDTVKSARYASAAKSIRDAINGPLWSPSEKVYFDAILGIPTGILTQHTSSLVVGFGIAPKERWSQTMGRTDTDPEAVKIGSPYFGAYYLDALYAMGRHQQALDYIRKHWGAMLDWGATTFWEKWEPSDSLCHAWSSCPTRDLPAQYVGLRPVAPGWSEWEMAPAFCDLKWANATVPTPHGNIKAAWRQDNGKLTLTVTVPGGTTAHIRVPVADAPNAVWRVNDRTNLPASVTAESVQGFWAVHLKQPGDYVIAASTP